MKSALFALALFAAGIEATQDYYNTGYYHAPNGHDSSHHQAYDPWAHGHANDLDDGWYSPTQQYSTPRIAYKTGYSKEPVYAMCYHAAGEFIQFAQFPGQATVVKVTTDSTTPHRFQVREHFILADACATGVPVEATASASRIDGAGDIFNPLAEFKSTGDLNPYQDPSRGTIDDLLAGPPPLKTGIQKDFLQNLSGPNSLMGREIVYAPAGGAAGAWTYTDPFVATRCCTIAYDIPPQVPASAPVHNSNDHTHHNSQGVYSQGYQNYEPRVQVPAPHAHSTYTAPHTAYKAPVAYSSYSAPQAAYKAPVAYSSYSAPQSSYKAPVASYNNGYRGNHSNGYTSSAAPSNHGGSSHHGRGYGYTAPKSTYGGYGGSSPSFGSSRSGRTSSFW